MSMFNLLAVIGFCAFITYTINEVFGAVGAIYRDFLDSLFS
jgi:hypothetical protein